MRFPYQKLLRWDHRDDYFNRHVKVSIIERVQFGSPVNDGPIQGAASFIQAKATTRASNTHGRPCGCLFVPNLRCRLPYDEAGTANETAAMQV